MIKARHRIGEKKDISLFNIKNSLNFYLCIRYLPFMNKNGPNFPYFQQPNCNKA